MKREGRNVLIDTSAWVEFFRGSAGTAGEVSKLIEGGRAVICGVISYELLQGTKSAEEAERLTDVLPALNYVEMTSDLWIRAGKLSAGLRRKGITLPMSDILIGALALEHDIEVLTVDEHFASIPGLKRYQ